MRLLVLGLGNVLLGDDGAGVEAAMLIKSRFRVPDGVEVLDGGTLGLSLLGAISEAETAVLVDAVRADDAPPGTILRLEGDEVPPAVAQRLSPHQVGVADLLDAARLIGRYPSRLVLCGVVPQSIELNVGLTAPVAAAIPALVDSVVAECARLGLPLEEGP